MNPPDGGSRADAPLLDDASGTTPGRARVTHSDLEGELTRLRAAAMAHQRALLQADAAVQDATTLLRRVRLLLTGIDR